MVAAWRVSPVNNDATFAVAAEACLASVLPARVPVAASAVEAPKTVAWTACALPENVAEGVGEGKRPPSCAAAIAGHARPSTITSLSGGE